MNIPSVSGDEEAVGFYLKEYLESLGWTVELQAVAEGQNNVIAYLNDTPQVWFSTHMDTVPPFIPPTEDDEKIYGRGATEVRALDGVTVAFTAVAVALCDLLLLAGFGGSPARSARSSSIRPTATSSRSGRS